MEQEEETALKSLSTDYLNLLIYGQGFSDVSFSVDGRVIHAHRCILAARSLFFRKLFSEGGVVVGIIPVIAVSYEVFLLVLQFLYSGRVSLTPQKHEARADCPDRTCCHTHCPAAVDLALETLSAARSFDLNPLALLAQRHLVGMVEKAPIEEVMRVLMASRIQNLGRLWTACSHLVAKSGLPAEVLAKYLPLDVVVGIEEIRLKITSLEYGCGGAGGLFPVQLHTGELTVPRGGDRRLDDEQHKLRRMRRALDSSDVEQVKLMVMVEGLNLDDALALHYAVENCSREVMKELLELGAADVNRRAGPAGKTPLHVAAEMVCPDMVAVLLDHNADPTARSLDASAVTPLDFLRGLSSDFHFKGARAAGLAHVDPNKLRLCLELLQSAVLVMSREAAAAAAATAHHHSMNVYPR
ncbi:BTB/POZ domain and ankyrin repeat-containing protein NPR5-like [Zingiber officinale]|uniref:BTB domain-containing protein n=1 Tax=Zingiber officinale TaxID=94328 RepID=A0A8J5FS52_ZINOF|nr:BTB/POZ domain and ankyrin repeat-containing protein NPR5-like [Zingiber officinale]KAG6492849.1 hypothetical protein ZIOFF_047817 [Zingiber officinale]